MYYSHFKAGKNDRKIMVQPTIHIQISVRTEVQDLTNVFFARVLDSLWAFEIRDLKVLSTKP